MFIGRTYSASYSLFGSLESEMDRDELANLRHDRDTLQEVKDSGLVLKARTRTSTTI